MESGLKRPMGNELCRRLHPNDSRNPFSFTVVPQGVMVWGRGTASAVDRVLSLIVDLRCIFSLSFIPLEPYPARYARHLPHAGKAGDTRETCHPQTFGHRPIYIRGEASADLAFPPLERRCVEKSGILVSQPSPLGKGDRVSGG